MSKKSKKQLNKEFLEKIKTITVGTGAKSSDTCPNCGESYSEHVVVPVVAIPLARKKKAKEEPKHEESSFAA